MRRISSLPPLRCSVLGGSARESGMKSPKSRNTSLNGLVEGASNLNHCRLRSIDKRKRRKLRSRRPDNLYHGEWVGSLRRLCVWIYDKNERIGPRRCHLGRVVRSLQTDVAVSQRKGCRVGQEPSPTIPYRLGQNKRTTRAGRIVRDLKLEHQLVERALEHVRNVRALHPFPEPIGSCANHGGKLCLM